jgi:hypothetical protein
MPQYFPRELRVLGDIPPNNVGAEPGVGDRVRVYRSTIHLDQPFINGATQAAQILTTDTVFLGRIPAGMRFLYGMITASVSLGTSTVAIGTAALPGLFRAAATLTAVDTPTLFGAAIAGQAPTALAADQLIILTPAVAALPNTAGQRLIVDLYFGNV